MIPCLRFICRMNRLPIARLAGVVVLLGTGGVLDGANSPDAVMRRAFELLQSGGLAGAAEEIKGNAELLESPLALGVLGQILECDGREAEAFEIYFRLLRRFDWMGEPGRWDYHLIRENWFPPSIPAVVLRGDAPFARQRLIAIGAVTGGEAWERVTSAIPGLRETDIDDWREALAAFPPGDPARLMPDGRSASVEDWLEFLKWQPSNEVVLRFSLLDSPPVIEWDSYSDYLLTHDPEMSVNTAGLLRATALRQSDRGSENFKELAGWVQARSDEELARLSGEVVGFLVASFGYRHSGSERISDSIHELIDRLLQVNKDPDRVAELRMIRAFYFVRMGVEIDSALNDADAAATAWALLSAEMRSESDLPNRLMQRYPFGKHFGHPAYDGFPELETVPPASVRLLEEEIDPAWADRLESPVLRVMAGDDRELCRQRLLAELETARGKGDGPVVRDLRRLLWAFSLRWEEKEQQLAREDCEKGASDQDDVFFAFESEIWRVRLAARAETWRQIRHPDELEELRERAKTFLLPGAETTGWVNRLLMRYLGFAVSEYERDQELVIFESVGHWLPLVNKQVWLTRGAEGKEEGMSDLAARLAYADSRNDREEGLQVARLAHARFPHRREWAVELALRIPGDDESFRLLDEAFPTGEVMMRWLLLTTSSLRVRENQWRAGDRNEAALRIARWEMSRRPSGDRRWLREVIPMLADFSPGHAAWEMLFDGAGSAEGAFDLMLEQGGREQLSEEGLLELARRVLLSGAYALEESPWIDRERFFGRRALPRPHRLRGTAKALPELIRASERIGAGIVFPREFLEDLKKVDPVTADWLVRVIAGDTPAPRFASEEEWFGRGQGPNRQELGKETMPAKPERSVLKAAIPWHERARFEAGRQ